MKETYVRVLCPNCRKEWTMSPDALPEAATEYSCPDCGTCRRLSEFMRTEHDLQALKQF
jgi:predicted RNA-binding Zn-ribbon protein involved in translation (DUF1610 family)